MIKRMLIQDIGGYGNEPDVIITAIKSDKLLTFLEQQVKELYSVSVDEYFELRTNYDLQQVRDNLGLYPPFAKKWLYIVNLEVFNSKELISLIKKSTTCCFLCYTSRYKDYKLFLDGFNNTSLLVADLYLSVLRRRDLLYVYDKFVTKEQRLSQNLFSYVANAYSSDVDAIFDLFEAIASGKKINDRKDIAEICGIGGLSTDNFLFSLLTDVSKSEKGVKTSIKNRIKMGVELCNILTPFTLYNYVKKGVKCLVQIKTLIISGDIYKTISEVPDGYELSDLKHYQKYMDKIETLETSRILILYAFLREKKWTTSVDMVEFMYKYYTYLCKLKLSEVNE